MQFLGQHNFIANLQLNYYKSKCLSVYFTCLLFNTLNMWNVAW